jgi:hypothetical protein
MIYGRARNHLGSRALSAFALSVLLGLCAAGCGSSSGKALSSSHSTASTTTASAEGHTLTSTVIPPGQRLRGDGDADNPADIDGNGDLDKTDHDNDYPVPASYKLPDADDKAVFAYGHRPSAGASRAISSLVKRYYAIASAADGAKACSMLLPTFAASLAEDYGQPGGPSYLRGDKTCQAIMSMLFKHVHQQLAEAIQIIEVRVDGGSARVIFGSRTMPASEIFLTRAGSSWRVEQLLGQPLP